ncbi:hypothetical protein LTR08_006227 [Meristemomyces frigidus]|nr:hypothetical protein LTR08_006227 [Meristemomyces frigidus]
MADPQAAMTAAWEKERRERFVNFVLAGVKDEEPRKAPLVQMLESEWATRTRETQEILNNGLKRFDKEFAIAAGHREAERVHRLNVIQQTKHADALEQLTRYKDLLDAIGRSRERANRLWENIVIEVIRPLNFSFDVKEWFRTRITENEDLEARTNEIVGEMTAQVHAMRQQYEFELTGGLWYPIKALSGGANASHLWATIDPVTGCVTDAVVRKETTISTAELADVSRWEGVHEPGYGRPMEWDNIFLDKELNTSFPKYPSPCIGDFGLAIQTSADDPLNPDWYNCGPGTAGFRAPEQIVRSKSEVFRDNMPGAQLLAHTNVFGVGAIMWSLVLGLDYDAGLCRLQETRDFRNLRDQPLTELLKTCIESCLEYQPDRRTSFRQLHLIIQETIASLADGDDMFDYFVDARRGVQPENAEHDLLDFTNVKYKDGFALWAGQ